MVEITADLGATLLLTPGQIVASHMSGSAQRVNALGRVGKLNGPSGGGVEPVQSSWEFNRYTERA